MNKLGAFKESVLLLTWNDSYSVNIAKFDEAHKELITLINEIHENMKAEKSPEVVGEVLRKLSRYTQEHFSAEESLMKKHDYPYFDDHKSEHSHFILEIDKLTEKYESSSNLINIQVLYFLKDWLTNHILNTDKRYSDFFNSKGIA